MQLMLKIAKKDKMHDPLTRKGKETISVVLPAYNEANNIPILVEKVEHLNFYSKH